MYSEVQAEALVSKATGKFASASPSLPFTTDISQIIFRISLVWFNNRSHLTEDWRLTAPETPVLSPGEHQRWRWAGGVSGEEHQNTVTNLGSLKRNKRAGALNHWCYQAEKKMHQPHVTGFAALGRGGLMAQPLYPLKRLWIHLPTSASSIPTWLCFPDRYKPSLEIGSTALLRYANISQGPRRVNLLSASSTGFASLLGNSVMFYFSKANVCLYFCPGGLESASIQPPNT